MIRRIRRWLAPRTHRVVAGHPGAVWDCRLCPATGWESTGPQAYDAAARHLAAAHGTVEARA